MSVQRGLGARLGLSSRQGMSARRSTVALAAGLLATAVLAGCSSSDTAGGGKGFVSGDGTITVVPADRRPDPVALAGTTLEGAPLDITSLRGKVVVLNVWGSWCAPCRKEAPDLQQAHIDLKGKGVEFVGVNVRQQSQSEAVAYQKKFGITYPSLADDGGKSLLALRGAVAANAIPSTLVLDTEGRIAVRISGTTTRTTLVDLVEDVVAGRAPQVA